MFLTTATLALGAYMPFSDGIHVSDTCQNYHVTNDQDASGSTVREQGVGSQEECCALCDSIEGCDAWSYAAVWSTCYCKSGFEGSYNNPGIVAGVRPPQDVLNIPLFRATESSSVGRWTLENNNLADVGGVLKYLHTEIVVEHEQNPSRKTRKYNIDVVGRWDFRIKNPPALLADSHMRTVTNFGPFVTFDSGKSTNPYFDDKLPVYGDWVGVQTHKHDPRMVVDVDLWWVSLSGFCPNLEFQDKGSHDAPNAQCMKYANPPAWANAQPWTMPLQGGLCSRGEYFPTGEPGCVYKYDAPGVVTVDEISGLTKQDCGGHTCSDWSEFRQNCTDASLRRRFSQDGAVENTTYCAEYDIAPACARDCNSTECAELVASGATIELGVPFWKGRCDAGANLKRRLVLARIFEDAAAEKAADILI